MKLLVITLITISVLLRSVIATYYVGYHVNDEVDGVREFEELSEARESYVHSLTKRAADQHSNGDKHRIGSEDLVIRAFDRQFDIHFEPRQQARRVLSEDFVAYAHYENGTQVPVGFDANSIRSGYVVGEAGSQATVYFDNGKLENAMIKMRNESFYVERVRRRNNSTALVMYRLSDVEFDSVMRSLDSSPSAHADSKAHRHSFCDAESLKPPANNASDSVVDRKKRQTNTNVANTCELLLVADYRFCAVVAGGADKVDTPMAQKAITSKMAVMITRIDRAYRDSNFGDLTNHGFAIKRIELYCKASVDDSPNSGYPFNVDKAYTHNSLLDAFSQSRRLNIGSYCLAHLFTARTFNGVLGLAYIAPPNSYSAGGICSDSYGYQWFNTGWSTHVDTEGRPMLSAQSEVVTAHELGHNWGSQHDPTTEECAPSSGHFLMFPYASAGYEASNHQFSPCSLRGIASALNARRSCFVAKVDYYCGNGVVEPGEQCDPGSAKSENREDPCCNEQCKLRESAQCSDSNSPCCANCKYAAANVKCRPANFPTCEPEGRCSGLSANCDNAAPVSSLDGQTCADDGRCKSGVCQSFCARNNLLRCTCTSTKDSCKRCCRASPELPCAVFNATLPNSQQRIDYYLSVGTPCTVGVCDAGGVCTQVQKSLTTRVWKFMSTISANSIVVFMRNNIVGTVVVFSLVLWLPICITICCLDRKQHLALKDEIMSQRTTRQYSTAPDENDPYGEELETSRKFSPVNAAPNTSSSTTPRPHPPTKPPPSKRRSQGQPAAAAAEPLLQPQQDLSYESATPYSIVEVDRAAVNAPPVKAPRPSKRPQATGASGAANQSRV